MVDKELDPYFVYGPELPREKQDLIESKILAALTEYFMRDLEGNISKVPTTEHSINREQVIHQAAILLVVTERQTMLFFQLFRRRYPNLFTDDELDEKMLTIFNAVDTIKLAKTVDELLSAIETVEAVYTAVLDSLGNAVPVELREHFELTVDEELLL